MADPTEEMLSGFDGHDVEAVRAALDAGADPCNPVRGKAPILWLLEEYTRSDRLGDCLRLLLERGAELPDPYLTPVLLNDAPAVIKMVRAQPSILHHRTTLVSAFTSLEGVSLLHVAAEYCHFEAARALVEEGADVNAKAHIDNDGLNGHTPLFHTVNSIHNCSEPIMTLLLEAGARTDISLAGITWGKGFAWETTYFDVTPLSYAQMGLMPQMHRIEHDIYSNIRKLLTASGRTGTPLRNVPNRYLKPKRTAE